MKRLTFTMMALIIAMAIPMVAIAMDHGSHDKEMSKDMDHDKHKAHDMKMDDAKEMNHDMHKGHDMAAEDGDFVEIGKDTQDGVVATVKVKAYDEKTRATMAKMGMNATHHVMVFFTDEKTGEAVASGKAALKIKGEDAKPAMLMQMGPGFGSDVSVDDGMSTFEIGTKLEDGKKRQFSVMFHNM
ncbi:MAG: hypothetical protein OET55_00310 [Desulfuromonadales bacterium]|jgi:hypothetical protein|nr:hypothetical protein [Desulfuromonadales bacterium]MDH3807121.1 hypothetical protein [Desulfuromonadales bacterium]MDH3868689.1 hypothetical protein [Desulfuromonadales bacterium]MDH3959697.1 hypothetical protein [Desulfuromonadales bacterium]